jgi:hypothetical protein
LGWRVVRLERQKSSNYRNGSPAYVIYNTKDVGSSALEHAGTDEALELVS